MKPIQKPVRQEREKQAGKQPHFERKARKSAVNSDIKSTPKAKVARPSRQSTVEGEKSLPERTGLCCHLPRFRPFHDKVLE